MECETVGRYRLEVYNDLVMMIVRRKTWGAWHSREASVGSS